MTCGAPPPLLRPEWWSAASGRYMEKRQLFLRSYHFSRKKSSMEKLRYSAVRVRRSRLGASACGPATVVQIEVRLVWAQEPEKIQVPAPRIGPQPEQALHHHAAVVIDGDLIVACLLG